MVKNFIITLLFSLVVIAGASIVWPKLTNQPRPESLSKIHQIVMGTPVGQPFANILGVSSDMKIEPLNVASAATDIASGLMGTVRERIAQLVVTQAVRQLVAQVDNLPPQQKVQVVELLCKP